MLTETVEIDQFIRPAEIEAILDQAAATPDSTIEAILDKASRFEGLSHLEVASLLKMDDKHLPRLFQVARSIKEAIYGNRIVMFAPLYVSDYWERTGSIFNYFTSFASGIDPLTGFRYRKRVVSKLGC